MTRYIISLLIGLITFPFAAYAEENVREQVLVFRSNGEISQFYSDELKSIEIVEGPISDDNSEVGQFQKFIFVDKTISIPVAEIDSVTFGNRNNIVPKTGVRRLNDTEVAYITSFDGRTLIFKGETPLSVIPDVGQKIYYDKFTDVFPYGLCGKVISQSREGSDISLSFEELDPAELFDAYFFSADETELLNPSRAEGEGKLDIKYEWDFELAGIKTKGRLGMPFSIQLKDVVTDLIKHYYHSKISLHLTPELLASFLSDDSNECEQESETFFTKSFPFVGGTIIVSVDVKSFLEAAAELGFEYHFENDGYIEFEWTRKNGENYFSNPIISQRLGDKKASYEIHLNGSLAFGPQLNIRIGVLFDAVGAGVKFRIGPKFSGELSLGILQKLAKEYEEEIYLKSKLDFCWYVKMKTFWYNFGFPLKHIEEHELPFEGEFETEHLSLNLFPEFHSRAALGKPSATLSTSADDKAVSVATYTDTDLEVPLEMGFDLVDGDSENSLKLNFEEGSSVIEAGSDSTQVFVDEFPLTGELKNVGIDKIATQPVFKYKDYIIKAAPVKVKNDFNFSPIIYAGANNGIYLVSGTPYVNQKTTETTTFIEGNLMPVGSKNDKIKDGLRKWRTVSFGVTPESILGSWRGKIKGNEIVLLLNADKSGTYNGRSFTYSMDAVYNGFIMMTFSDSSKMKLVIKSLTDQTMKVAFGDTTTLYTLTKK